MELVSILYVRDTKDESSGVWKSRSAPNSSYFPYSLLVNKMYQSESKNMHGNFFQAFYINSIHSPGKPHTFLKKSKDLSSFFITYICLLFTKVFEKMYQERSHNMDWWPSISLAYPLPISFRFGIFQS